MSQDRPMMTTTEAGRYLGVTQDTVRNYWERGLIEGYLTIPVKHGRLKVYRESVEEFDRQRKNQAPRKS